MKTYNELKVRSLGRKLGVLGLTLMLAASCGSDKKNTTSSSSSSNQSTSTLTSNDANFASDWSSIKSTANCNGNYGRASDRYYYTTGNSSTMTAGSISGTASGTWLGQNDNGSVVAVQKVVSGGTTYYNVAISACIVGETVNGTTYTVLGDDDSLSNVNFSNFSRSYAESYGLDCSHDFLAYGVFSFTSSKYQSMNYYGNGSLSLSFGTSYYNAKCY